MSQKISLARRSGGTGMYMLTSARAWSHSYTSRPWCVKACRVLGARRSAITAALRVCGDVLLQVPTASRGDAHSSSSNNFIETKQQTTRGAQGED